MKLLSTVKQKVAEHGGLCGCCRWSKATWPKSLSRFPGFIPNLLAFALQRYFSKRTSESIPKAWPLKRQISAWRQCPQPACRHLTAPTLPLQKNPKQNKTQPNQYEFISWGPKTHILKDHCGQPVYKQGHLGKIKEMSSKKRTIFLIIKMIIYDTNALLKPEIIKGNYSPVFYLRKCEMDSKRASPFSLVHYSLRNHPQKQTNNYKHHQVVLSLPMTYSQYSLFSTRYKASSLDETTLSTINIWPTKTKNRNDTVSNSMSLL